MWRKLRIFVRDWNHYVVRDIPVTIGDVQMIKPELNADGNLLVRPELKVKPADFADTTFQAYAEKIAYDYTAIVRKLVMPGLPGLDGLKLRELRVLSSVDFYVSPLSPVHIADILRYDAATVTRAVDRLVAAGKMERTSNPSDIRSVFLTLTEDGVALSREYTTRIKATFAAMEEQLTFGLTEKEKTDFIKVMLKISRRATTMRELSPSMEAK
jgi:DNA-binding MarR family transcriptional regulator